MGPVHQLARVEQPSKISKLKPTPASSTTPSSTHPPPQSQPGAGAALDVGVDLGGDGVPVRDGWAEPDGDGHVLESLDDGGHPRLRGRPPTPGPPVSTPRPPAPKPSPPAPSSYPSVKQQEGDKLSSMEKRKLSSFQQAKAPDAKRFRSPMAAIPVSSPGIKIMLSSNLASQRTATPRSSSPAQISPSQGTSRRSRKRKLRSKIWKDFEPDYHGLKIIEAKCIHCHKIFQANRDHGTSSCLRHLQTCEGRMRLDDMITKLKAESVSADDETLKNWKFDQEVSENELVKLIVVHELPFSLVEYSKFRSFVSTLNPWFKHLSRTTIKKYCVGAYEEAMTTLRKGIESQNCRFSLTADLWTSNQNIGYLCVTCHFIDVNWDIHKRIIKFTPVETPHNGINLFNAMLRSLQDWNLEERVFAITLDNASTNDSFVGSLKDNLFAKSLLLHDGELLHYRCAAHVLNLIAQEGLLAMKEAINNIRESVKYIRSSPARGERFEKIVHRLGISCTRRPHLDVATRWNSTYEMLISAIPYKRAFEVLSNEDHQYVHEPSIEEWNLFKKLCNLLEVFRYATKVVSGSQYPTINLYFHQLWEVKKLLEKEASSSEPVIVSMVIEMKKKFKKYWDLSYLKICVPVVLDPRFKLGFLDFRLKKGFGNMAGAYFSKIEQTFRELFKEYSLQTIGSVCNNTKSNSKDVIIVDANDPWADWGQIQNVQQSKTIDELEQYLSEETVPVTASFNILEHWKVYASKYPTLARMARDILAIPASTVASESAFSTGERVISDYRSSLASGTVEALICLQDCLRSKESNEDNIAGNIIGGEEEEDYWQFEVEASKIKAAGR